MMSTDKTLQLAPTSPTTEIAIPPHPASLPGGAPPRPRVAGKFIFIGDKKFYVRGVTYGPFKPEADGSEYHNPQTVERDFALMAANNINTVRTYTMPPRWLLDFALKFDLRVMVGLPWEQHITFLDDSRRVRDLERRVREAVRGCDEHSALLAYTIGNEIPSPIVRWYGHRKIEKFLERLYWAAKEEDPEGLVTYVNYPSTEYLDLPFLDFVSFNVYLESQDKLQAYVARLQNLADDRPLVMAEIGLDSLRNGEGSQARTLEWQARTVFAGGCAGLFVFAWTDEWFRGGHEIDDWKFGVVTRERDSKPALEVVRHVFQHVPLHADESWPFISVVICSYNGSRTIQQSLDALQKLEYPKFEVIVVDDGSQDHTSKIARDFGVQLIRQENSGLSAARNAGWRAAKGEIVAYLDDDAAPDPHWLLYLASAFMASTDAGIGGPNISFQDDKFIAHCVDHSPGNPTHVLVTDRVAEHLPGCNMAFRRSALEAIAGFDATFRIAGDDVDLCWRLQERGLTLGFHPGAMVWHHRRSAVGSYWSQQMNYGRAEAMLERKWPEKYNAVGHLRWNGRLYGKGFWQFFRLNRRRIYHGSWGSALFQSAYNVAPGMLSSILMLPEWYLLIVIFALTSTVSAAYSPLRFSIALLAFALFPPAAHAWICAHRSFFNSAIRRRWPRWQLLAATALLHFLQPAARLTGRLRQGLTPWRKRGADKMALPSSRNLAIWSENKWRAADQRLQALYGAMRETGAPVARGGDFDRWDLETRGGLFGSARAQLVIEEHGDSKQLVRVRVWPVGQPLALIVSLLFAGMAMVSATRLDWWAWAALNLPALGLLYRVLYECGTAMSVILDAIPQTLNENERIISGAKSNDRT
jgi:GT2 family glycosyltransferase